MSQKNKVFVKINGQEYPIIGLESKEYLLKVGTYVDEQMQKIAKYNSKLSTSMIAVLTSINITDQFLKLKNEYEDLQTQQIAPLSELEQVKKDLKENQGELSEKRELCLVFQKQVEELIGYKEKYETESVGLKEQLQQKETEVEKAQEIINDLQNKLFENQIKLVQARKELEEYLKVHGESSK